MQLNTSLLKAHDLRISMDGQGSWRENKRSAVSRADRREGEARHNVFVERLWKTVKYEEVCLKAYDNVGDARAKLTACILLYDERRPHRAVDGKTPPTSWPLRRPSETPRKA